MCKAVVDAEVNVRDNKVFLRKRCRDHGTLRGAGLQRRRDVRRRPSVQQAGHDARCRPRPRSATAARSTAGSAPTTSSTPALGLIEVNTACNLDCPVCFADSGHQPDGFSLTSAQVEAGLDAFVAAEGEPEVVMFSGGEPSIHPQILEFCAMARDKGVRIGGAQHQRHPPRPRPGLRPGARRARCEDLPPVRRPRRRHPPRVPGPRPARRPKPRRSTAAPKQAWP